MVGLFYISIVNIPIMCSWVLFTSSISGFTYLEYLILKFKYIKFAYLVQMI